MLPVAELERLWQRLLSLVAVPLPKLSPGAAATLLYVRKGSTCPLELQRPQPLDTTGRTLCLLTCFGRG